MPSKVRRLVLLGGMWATLTMAACSGDDDPASAPSAPLSSAPGSSMSPTTGATAPADPFAVPDVIDEAYVNRILAKLYSISGDVVRTILANDNLELDNLRPLRAIYNDPQFEDQAQGLNRVLESKENFKEPPGDRQVTVERLLRAENNCIIAEVLSDFSAVVKSPPPTEPGRTSYLALTPTQADADELGLNPTPWSINYAATRSSGSPPEAPCD